MHQPASRRPDMRDCLLAAAARRTLGATTRAVAARVGIDYSTLTNHESCRYRLGRQKERELFSVLLRMYAERGVPAVALSEDASMDEQRAALASAIVKLRTSGLFPLARGIEGGTEDLVDEALRGVLLQFHGGAAKRLAELLALEGDRA